MDEKEKKEKIPRQPMPEQDPMERRKNYREVPHGYSPETAMREASRCLQCKNPACRNGCPVEIDIPAFINRIKEGDFAGGIAKIKEKNLLPQRSRRRTCFPLFVGGSALRNCNVRRNVSWARRESRLPLVG